ncbi:MAG: hypothetical protein FJ397_02350 [Verrucomicrobia bacterium]|nr:hypothetical protein [Verrucomicrobiota bacterium]
MPPFLEVSRAAAAHVARAGGAFALWTLWLGLLLLLALQAWIATRHELTVPAPLLRRLEAELARQGFRANVSATSFDPTGRVFARDVRLFLPALAEPVLEARGVYAVLDPTAALRGEILLRELQFQDAAVLAPPQLTPSGRSEPLASGIGAVLRLDAGRLHLDQFDARVQGILLQAGGMLALPRPDPAAPPLAAEVARLFPSAARAVLAAGRHVAEAEDLRVRLEVSPAGSGRHQLGFHLTGTRIPLPPPAAGEARAVALTGTLSLGPERVASGLQLSAATLQLEGLARLQQLHVILPPLRLDALDDGWPATAEVMAAAVETADGALRAVTARLRRGAGTTVTAKAGLRLLDLPLELAAEIDWGRRSGRVTFAGELSPGLLDLISRRLGTDVARFYSYEALTVEEGAAVFGPDWTFARLDARVRIPRMNSYGVTMEDGRAVVTLEPGRFRSPEAFARIGENHARGTYEHDLRTHAFRFLLDGRLRPLAISRWFGPWWPKFFTQLEFPDAPPAASVDLQGVWRQGHRAAVFVGAQAGRIKLRGAPAEEVRTRLFIRPGWIDGLEFRLADPSGAARGTFTHVLEPGAGWRHLDLDLQSSLGLGPVRALLGSPLNSLLDPYAAEASPEISLRGRLHGPAAPAGAVNRLELEGRVAGAFRFHGFPLQEVAFKARVAGPEVNVDPFSARYAEGRVSGNARVWGAGAARRVGFNASLEDASLGPAATTLQAFLAARRGEAPAPPDRFVRERANLRLNLSASAEGDYADPFSFRGDGNATLQGPELGEVPMLGLLSELFTFTSLRFTEARANLRLEGPRLIFPQVELRGANSAIDASGEFTLDRRELRFNAKVFPFQESGNVLKTVVGAVLTPLSNALEVRLTGTLERPRWEFVMGPRNFLRTLAGENEAGPAAPPPVPPPAP